MSETESFCRVDCKDFDDFVEKCKELLKEKGEKRSLVFRGQKRAASNEVGKWKWLLCTSFERACERFGVNSEKRVELERNMIREFQRRLHLYMTHIPDEILTDEWLSLMQHYGAPTRLLDFTYSPYVAAYFAFECAKPNSNVAVWAIDATWCKEQLEASNKCLAEHYSSYGKRREGKEFDVIFRAHQPQKLVLAVNPFRRNERLAYQKGVFLCPGDVTVGFMENLSSFGNPDGQVTQYSIPTGENGNFRNNALKELERMNINRTTLFPGLDGFAQSFSVRIITDESIIPTG
ncbi:MAG: FRG domain-containing protein [Dehalococcoidales bacterium]|nr:FRG domain-containing protein [Dehalococcoidales bacterium]